jgi:tetratricopeptide (TPR) repeat protein
MPPIHWIETELSGHIPHYNLTTAADFDGGNGKIEGADFDGNGKIEGSERADLNDDGDIDTAEWRNFLGDNNAALKRVGGHFNMYYNAGKAFSPDNPLQDLLSIESEMASLAEVAEAYSKVEKILDIVRKGLPRATTPQMKLKLVYDAMKQVGIKFKNQENEGFVSNIVNGCLDCDTSSYVVLAVAHELGWPVHLVSAPSHMFVRWDDGAGTRFNMDFGKIRTDEYYLSALKISQEAIKQHVYLSSLNYRQTISVFYINRGDEKDDLGRYEEAIKDYDTAISLNPNDALTYNNRGLAKDKQGRYQEAIKDYDTAISLNPNHAFAYNNRGGAQCDLGRYQEAIEDYDTAIRLIPNFAAAYNNRGNAECDLGRYQESIKDYDEAIRLNPNHADAYNDRGLAKAEQGIYPEAIKDYDEAIKLDPSFSAAYNNRNLALEKLQKIKTTK